MCVAGKNVTERFLVMLYWWRLSFSKKVGWPSRISTTLDMGGPGKLRSFWEDNVYVVPRRPHLHKAVYEVTPEQGTGRKRMLHCNLMLPCPFLPYEATSENPPETHNRRPTSLNNQRQSDSITQSEEERPVEDFGFNPNQLSKVTRHIRHIPTGVVEDGETELSSQLQHENAGDETDEQTNNVQPNVVVTNVPFTSSDMPMQSSATQRPQRIRNPPVMLSYYDLGQPADIGARIQPIIPHISPPQFMYHTPMNPPTYFGPRSNVFVPLGYVPPLYWPIY